MNRNLELPPVIKYPVSDVGLHFIRSCDRLAAILQDVPVETWQVAIGESVGVQEDSPQSLSWY